MATAHAKPAQPETPSTWGMLAEFDSAASLYHAAEKVRDAGYKRFDCYSPFPVHGIEEAMGAPRSKLGYFVAVAAFLGAGGMYLLQWWVSAVAYPVVVDGKPLNAWEQFIPPTFEIGVLFAGITALLAMLGLNGLPRFNHPLFRSERFLRASDDGFFIAIETRDPLYNIETTRGLLESAGATSVEEVNE